MAVYWQLTVQINFSFPLKTVMFLYCPDQKLVNLDQVAQRSCGCPLPGSIQGQVGWGSEQPGLVEGVPAQGGWNQMIFKVPSNPNHSMIQ